MAHGIVAWRTKENVKTERVPSRLPMKILGPFGLEYITPRAELRLHAAFTREKGRRGADQRLGWSEGRKHHRGLSADRKAHLIPDTAVLDIPARRDRTAGRLNTGARPLSGEGRGRMTSLPPPPEWNAGRRDSEKTIRRRCRENNDPLSGSPARTPPRWRWSRRPSQYPQLG